VHPRQILEQVSLNRRAARRRFERKTLALHESAHLAKPLVGTRSGQCPHQILGPVFRERIDQGALAVVLEILIVDPVFLGERDAETQQVRQRVFLTGIQAMPDLGVRRSQPLRPSGRIQPTGVQARRE